MLGVLLIIALVILIVYYSIWTSTYWSRRGIKGPRGMPIFGNMFNYLVGRRHYGYVYEDVYKSLPTASYVGMYRVLNEPAILLREPDIIKEIMVKKFSSFRDNVLYIDEGRDAIMMCDPFVAKGEKWRIMRNELVPVFTPNKVKLSYPHIAAVCKKLESYLEENVGQQSFEAKDLCSKYTLDVVASTAYGLDGESFTNTNSDFTQLVENLFMPNPYSLVETTALLFLPKLGNFINYRYIPTKVQHWLSTIIGRVLSQRRKLKDLTNNHSDFIQWLIEARQKAGEPVDEFIILGHCSTFLLEGFETSASLMSFALYEFAINPHIQDQIHSEIDRVVCKYKEQLCFEALLEMTYLEAALYETLRLFPPMLALLKHCTQPFELPSQFKGIQLREKVVIGEGTVFIVPVKAVHNDKEIFPQPDKFDPDRFTEENKRQRVNCAFLGFGEGPRMCPGMRFGLTQSKAGLATMLMKYKVELSPKAKPLKIATTTFLTSSQSGIWITFKPRTHIVNETREKRMNIQHSFLTEFAGCTRTFTKSFNKNGRRVEHSTLP